MVMQGDAKWDGIRSRGIRLGGLAAVAMATAVGVPVAATASSHVVGPPAEGSAAAGLVYGGKTSQGWPVVVEVTRNRRGVAQAYAALHLDCTTGNFANLPDRYVRLRVSKRRKFGFSFGPNTVRNDDGTTSDFDGSISGTFNRARTKVSGKWRLHVVDHDASGAVVGSCDSGSVRWSAKQ
jgi:hypothetical protein